ncbi:MAG: pseudouridine synthase [Elusimicrobiales bacterium]|nr:pseudouridine synthase [Elusimicrobiales bacterium]
MKKPRYIAFFKPYNVLSQFTEKDGHPSLKNYAFPKGVYPAGRLDADSEGLLILTNDGQFQNRISSPKFNKTKTYFAQVERIIDKPAIDALKKGLILKDGPTLPCSAEIVEEPVLPLRNPPIRSRKTVPTSWVKLIIREGRNRQVRRMLANVKFPILRLIRYAIEDITIDGLEPGQWRELNPQEIAGFRNKKAARSEP